MLKKGTDEKNGYNNLGGTREKEEKEIEADSPEQIDLMSEEIDDKNGHKRHLSLNDIKKFYSKREKSATQKENEVEKV